jgi:hypothetical protein
MPSFRIFDVFAGFLDSGGIAEKVTPTTWAEDGAARFDGGDEVFVAIEDWWELSV